MASWYYFDNDGQKHGPYSGGQLREFARRGVIAPETVIENEEGKTTPANKVKGLTFNETPKSAEVDVYGMASAPPFPPLGEQPAQRTISFACSNPDCQNVLKVLEKHIGRTLRCPDCQASVTVPAVVVSRQQDAADSLSALFKKAEAGDPQSMLELAYAYNKKENFNPKAAFFWIERSAELGNAQAQFELADICGSEGTQYYDLRKSLYWLDQSARHGCTEAKHNLATHFLAGQGVPQNNQSALYWMEQAANDGHAGAKRKLGIFYIEGIGVAIDKERGRKLLHEAVSLGDVTAKELLNTLVTSVVEPASTSVQANSKTVTPRSSTISSQSAPADATQPSATGSDQRNSRRRLTAAMMAALFGAFGGHKYYLGKWEQGVAFTAAVVCSFGLASVVTGIIALLDTIRFLRMSDEDFASQCASSDAMAVIVPPVKRKNKRGGGSGCCDHPSRPAVANCRKCANLLCQDCFNDYGITQGEYAGQALCYDCTAELVAENIANVTMFRNIVRRERLFMVIGMVLGYFTGLGLLADMANQGLDDVQKIMTVALCVGVGGSLWTIIKQILFLFVVAVIDFFKELSRERGSEAFGSILGFFIWSSIIVIASPAVTLYRFVNRFIQIRRLNGIITHDSDSLRSMRDYFEYTQTMEEHSGIDLATLASEGSELFDNTYARAVLSQGEQAAQAELRRGVVQIAANGEIIRNVVRSAGQPVQIAPNGEIIRENRSRSNAAA